MDGVFRAFARNGYTISDRKPEKKTDRLRDLGICGRIILKGIYEIGCQGEDWIHLSENSDQWRALVNTVIKLSGSIKQGDFRDYLGDYYSIFAVLKHSCCVHDSQYSYYYIR
jgi:hypothetical protein